MVKSLLINDSPLRAVYAHEHITIDLSGHKNDDDCRLDDPNLAFIGLSSMKNAGVETVLDQTARGMGRNPLYTQSVCDKANINVVHATGFYKVPFLPDECCTLEEADMAKLFLSEINEGMDTTGIKAGFIGEIGTGHNQIHPMEEKIFRAAAIAHCESGAPICTHATLGTMGEEQIKLLAGYGVDLSHVVLSHIDLSGDLQYMLRLLDTGVNIAFDTIGKNNYQLDEHRIMWLNKLCEKGFAGQIVLSMDLTRKSSCRELGYDYLMVKFIPKLMQTGFSESWLEALLYTNPRRIYRI